MKKQQGTAKPKVTYHRFSVVDTRRPKTKSAGAVDAATPSLRKLKNLDLKRVFVHSVSDDDTMRRLSVSSKLNADWGALTDLRDRGREKADEWIEANYASIGRRSTVDIHERYL